MAALPRHSTYRLRLTTLSVSELHSRIPNGKIAVMSYPGFSPYLTAVMMRRCNGGFFFSVSFKPLSYFFIFPSPQENPPFMSLSLTIMAPTPRAHQLAQH